MSGSDQANKATSTNQEYHFLPPVVAYTHQPFNSATVYPAPPPLGAYLPPFFAHPLPQDMNYNEIGQNRVPAPLPYIISFPPPNMAYAFPPPWNQVPPASPPTLTKPKRKQVKMACTNCAAACKRCDEGRPCERCQKYGIGDSCRDGQRKERKKGIKRTFKRKNKTGKGEWIPFQAAAANANAPIPVGRLSSPPEGYFVPIVDPPPFAPLPRLTPEIPSGQEGSVPANGQPPIMSYFLSAYSPPYGHLALYPGMPSWVPHPGQTQTPRQVQPQQTIQQPQQSASYALDSSTGGGESPSPGPKKKVEGSYPVNVNGQSQTENSASGATSPILNGAAASEMRSCRAKERDGVEEGCWMECDCTSCLLDTFDPFLSIPHSSLYL